MKRQTFLSLLLAAGTQPSFVMRARAETDESLRNEVQAAINRGLKYLFAQQDSAKGFVGSSEHPAITALAAMAAMGNPETKDIPEHARKAYQFLILSQKDDGGIYTTSLPNYNTSLALTALTLISGEPGIREAALKARRFVIKGQYDEGTPGEMDTPYDGGVGYGSKPPTDMSNTHFALEALYHSRKLLQDDPDRAKSEPQLNYQAAIDFVTRCQHLASTNKSSWVSEDKTNKGGFVYRPGESKVAPPESGDGTTPAAPRAYASMGYAGLLAFIYADVKPSDPRIKAVREWLSANYSVTENPGIGSEGLYYYYHTMAKALNTAQIDFVETPQGRRNWRSDLARHLFNVQREDGSWINENGRWMEKDSVLVTAYAVLALEHIIRGL
jgi:squalene-hopene/tetraprenyl-beta-curcumene cyclase